FGPNVQVFGIAGLQPNEFGAAGFLYNRVRLAQLVGRLVDTDQFGDRVASQGVAVEQMFPAVNYHPELGAPVADVIVANHVVAQKCRDASQRIAQDGAPDMADVHRLGNVGRTKINYDAPRVSNAGNAQTVISQELGSLQRDGFRFEAEVDKSGARNRRNL